MGLIMLDPLMYLEFWNVLAYFAAQRHIDELVTLANPQNGLSGVQKNTKDLNLSAIPFRLDPSGFR